MIKSLFESPVALCFAVVIHGALIAVLIFSFNWQSETPDQPKVNVVDAVAVDESKILNQIEMKSV